MLCMLLPLTGWSQREDSRCGQDTEVRTADPVQKDGEDLTDGKEAVGRWFTLKNEGIVELFLEEDILKGRIVWMNTDKPLKDTHNKNKALRDRPLLGLLIIDGLKWNGERWDEGKVYDPDTGKSYDCLIWVADGKLHLRGHIGALGKTLKWDPAPAEMPDGISIKDLN